MKLSVLICSLARRLSQSAGLINALEQQAQGKSVEILWLGDNSLLSVGEKRNKLLHLSKGDYLCFVDDDDWVEDDYIEQLLKGIEQNPDVVCFNVGYRNAEIGGDEVPALFSIQHVFNNNYPNKRLRMPNHLMAVKRCHALKAGFPEKSFGEDTDYGLRLRGDSKAQSLLKTEYHCGKVLYHYRFNPHTSATHHHSPVYKKPVSRPMVKMDVVLVSDGSNAGLMKMTQEAVNSIAAENINVIVLEKMPSITYTGADTFLQKEPFNYNQCLNQGAAMGNAELICFANNDVLFPTYFLQGVLQQLSLHPAEVLSVQNQHGYMPADRISGFCFIMRRSAWLKLGGLNTDYLFWCADNVVTEQLNQYGLKERKSPLQVTHFTSVSLSRLSSSVYQQYTYGCVKQFNRRYHRNVLGAGE